jgi:Fe-S cluster biogenesis protein NfuA
MKGPRNFMKVCTRRVLYKSPCYDGHVTDTTALYDAVDKALDEIRPYIHSHAGDVNIIDVSDTGVVKLQMVGTCHGCPMSMLTLRLGIERILIEKVPGVTEIVSIRPDDIDIDAFAGGDDDDE